MAGSYYTPQNNMRNCGKAKLAPPLLSAANYHGRTINVRIVTDDSEHLFFRCKLSYTAGLIRFCTPSEQEGQVAPEMVTAAGFEETDGLRWLVLCISKLATRQQLVRNNMFTMKQKLSHHITYTDMVTEIFSDVEL